MFLGNHVPRRLQRFQRSGEGIPAEALDELGSSPGYSRELEESILGQGEQSDVKKKTMELALHEVKKFKDTHKRLPKKQEYDKIAENIYEQLKREELKERLLSEAEKTGGRRKRKKKVEDGEEKPFGKKSAQKKEVLAVLDNLKGLEVSDLFGDDQKKPGKKKSGELDELSNLGLDFEEEKELKLGDKKEAKEGNCPSCGKPAKDIIYCPGCGTAYCKNCAKKVEKLADRTKYYCPSCGKTIER